MRWKTVPASYARVWSKTGLHEYWDPFIKKHSEACKFCTKTTQYLISNDDIEHFCHVESEISSACIDLTLLLPLSFKITEKEFNHKHQRRNCEQTQPNLKPELWYQQRKNSLSTMNFLARSDSTSCTTLVLNASNVEHEMVRNEGKTHMADQQGFR